MLALASRGVWSLAFARDLFHCVRVSCARGYAAWYSWLYQEGLPRMAARPNMKEKTMAMKMHESLVDVVDNGDGTFTISRGKLAALVQGQVFMDIYDDADVDEVESGMDRAYRRVLGREFESAEDYAVAQVAAFEARSFA